MSILSLRSCLCALTVGLLVGLSGGSFSAGNMTSNNAAQASPAPPAKDGEADEIAEAYERTAAGLVRRARSIAESAREMGLAGSAWQLERKILRFQPDHAELREELGFVRRGDVWLGPREQPPEDDPEHRQYRRGESRFERDRERLLERIEREIYPMLERLEGGKPRLHLQVLRALRGFEMLPAASLEEYREQDGEAARRHTEQAHSLHEKLARWREEPPTGSPSETPTRFDQYFPGALTKRESDRVLLVSTHHTQEQLTHLLSRIELAISFANAAMGVDDPAESMNRPDDETYVFLFVETREQWRALIDHLPDLGEARREQLKQATGTTFGREEAIQHTEGRTRAGVVDSALNACARLLLQADPWLELGFAYYVTEAVNNTVLTRLIAMSGTGAPGVGEYDLALASGWRRMMLDLVLDGNDPPIREILSLRLSNLTTERVIKAHSLATYITDTGRLADYAEAMRRRGVRPEQALATALDKTPGELHVAWSRWVLETH